MNQCIGIFGKVFGHKITPLFQLRFQNKIIRAQDVYEFRTSKELVKYWVFKRISQFANCGPSEISIKKVEDNCKRCGRRVEDE